MKKETENVVMLVIQKFVIMIIYSILHDVYVGIML